jgi:preprotein translocase subunit SecD
VASAPVQGFALTLGIGVAVSMFTAILVTRTLLRLFVGTPLAHHPRLFSPHLGRK